MSQSPPYAPSARTPPAAPRDPLALLTLAALVIALALVLVRITMMETVREGFDLASGSTQEILSFPGPTTSLVLDLLCFVPAILVLIRRSIDPEYVLRPHWSHLLMVLLGAWVLLSVSWASDKFAALVTAFDWCGGLAIAWAASQLIRSWSRLRIVLGTAVGILLICLAQGAVYRFVEHPATVEHWDSIRDQTFRERGWKEDDFIAKQFDRKIRAGEMVGFFKSPNTFAAVMAMGAIISAGFALQRWRDAKQAVHPDAEASNAGSPAAPQPVAPLAAAKDGPAQDDQVMAVILGLPALLAVGLIILAQSRTALAGLALCAALFAVLWRIRDRLAANATRAFVIGGIIVLLGMLAVVAIGLSTGGLLHESLTFRWQYWIGAWKLFLTHPVLGVGWSNFGNAYLAFRLPVAAEEIKDPHNLIFRFLTETGIIGMILAIGWIKRSLFEATRPHAPRSNLSTLLVAAGGNILPVLLSISLLFAGLRVAANTPLSLDPLELLKLLLLAFLMLFALSIAVVRDKTTFSADDRPAPLLLWAAIVALGGFLLHNMVDFALFENGPMMLFMLVLGAVLGVRHPGVAGRKPRTWAAVAALGGLFVGLLAAVGLVVVPVASAESLAHAANVAAPRSRADALSLLRQAIAASPVANFDYANRAVRLMQNEPPNELMTMLTLAIDADPRNPQPWLDRARYRQVLPAGDASNSVALIRADYTSGIARNPADPRLRIEFAEWLDNAGLGNEAVAEYEAALAANAQMDAAEPRRLSREQVARIEQRLKGQ